jgi:hypothetical protein
MSYDKTWRLTPENARPWEVTQTFDQPPLDPALAAALLPRIEQPYTFAPIKVPTSAYNHKTAKGRARRS